MKTVVKQMRLYSFKNNNILTKFTAKFKAIS